MPGGEKISNKSAARHLGISSRTLREWRDIYRKARFLHEKACGLKEMEEGREKEKTISQINELFPRTENIEEHMPVEEEQ